MAQRWSTLCNLATRYVTFWLPQGSAFNPFFGRCEIGAPSRQMLMGRVARAARIVPIGSRKSAHDRCHAIVNSLRGSQPSVSKGESSRRIAEMRVVADRGNFGDQRLGSVQEGIAVIPHQPRGLA